VSKHEQNKRAFDPGQLNGGPFLRTTMNCYLNLLSEHFGNRNPNNQVVDWNGYDQLEKESAVEFYKGKTWQQVLKHL
jgi:hypothetical protein